jgi:hypothetical protein
METTKPSYYEVLDNLSESLRASRRSAFLLQLSEQDQAPFVPAPRTEQTLSMPQVMAEIV